MSKTPGTPQGHTPSPSNRQRTAAEDPPLSDDASAPGSPAPADLRDGGLRYWQDVTGTYALRVDELALLAEACRTVDDLAAMRLALAETGHMVQGSKGQPRPNPLLTEIRGSRLVLLRLSAQLGLPDEGEEAGATPAARRAARAANARWRMEAVADGEA